MKRGRLPLTALRSFEAAGRHQSFTLAAEELFVSQAAISRQVRELEALLGHDLFERHHRQAVLTGQGQVLLELLTASFDNIARALQEIRAVPLNKPLQISVEPSFAACWLVPRLSRFRQDFPEIDISLEAETRLTEFRRGEAELAIRWSQGATSWPRVQAEQLFSVRMFPVVSPALRASGPALEEPANLLAYPLLHEENQNMWRQWFMAAGISNAPPQRGPLFTDKSLTLDAAARGQGVALGDAYLAEEKLLAGELEKVFGIEVAGGAYWLVAPDLARFSPAAEKLVNWLRAELNQ